MQQHFILHLAGILASAFTASHTQSDCQKKKEINNFQDLLEISQALTQNNDQIIMAHRVTRNLNSFGFARLTKNHQHKIRLRRRLTQTLVFPKFSCNMSRFCEEEIPIPHQLLCHIWKVHSEHFLYAKGYKANWTR